MIRKLNLFLQTARHLKLKQVTHQIKYRLIKPRSLALYEGGDLSENMTHLAFGEMPPIAKCWRGKGQFTFLNLEVDFGSQINWNLQKHGKLWNYNLQYANYLLQPDCTDNEKEHLITDLYKWLSDGRLQLEPYPVSLRSINMMRWLSVKKDASPELVKNLFAELEFLSNRLEYHLLGNHLLENAFALIMGGGFFSRTSWVETGKKILKEELAEQILADGAHFELSSMYHQIVFFRLLELIDWYSKWERKESGFEDFLRLKASDMRAWLEQMSFEDGGIPHFNDSADGIAYSTQWLVSYAESLSIQTSKLPLGESGYRSIARGSYECKVDFAQLGPSYQPGHAHADALSFIIYYNGKPLFVEQGTSTYQIGAIRERERSTAAHNTVLVDRRNQSNVWGGFRVAERARTKIIEDQAHRICAEHNGYRKLGLIHRRTFAFEENAVRIVDELIGNDQCSKEFHLHIHPGLQVKTVNKNVVKLSNGILISFEPDVEVQIQHFEMANGYNRYETGQKVVVPFGNELSTTILMREENQ